MRTWSVVFALLFSASANAQAIRTFVSALNGTDFNQCTRTDPCRNFSAAATMVADRGEVVALDSGGYGPIIITKELVLLGAPGVHASIAPSSGNAITINLGIRAVVWIRNLYLRGPGADRGIWISGFGAVVHIQDVVIDGFGDGLYVDDHSEVDIADSTLRNNSRFGVYVEGTNDTAPAKVAIHRCHLVRTIGNAVNAGNDAWISAIDTTAVDNGTAFRTQGTNVRMDLERVSVMGSFFALINVGGASTTIRFANCTIVDNNTALLETGAGQIISGQNNTVIGNAAGETVLHVFTLK